MNKIQTEKAIDEFCRLLRNLLGSNLLDICDSENHPLSQAVLLEGVTRWQKDLILAIWGGTLAGLHLKKKLSGLLLFLKIGGGLDGYQSLPLLRRTFDKK